MMVERSGVAFRGEQNATFCRVPPWIVSAAPLPYSHSEHREQSRGDQSDGFCCPAWLTECTAQAEVVIGGTATLLQLLEDFLMGQMSGASVGLSSKKVTAGGSLVRASAETKGLHIPHMARAGQIHPEVGSTSCSADQALHNTLI